MAVLPWICRRCYLRSLSHHGAAPTSPRSPRRVLHRERQRTYATLVEDQKAINWAEWFDSAAPYTHFASSASVHDRGRKSHHGREPPIWRPTVRLHSSFAPHAEALERRSPPQHSPLRRSPSSPIIAIIPPKQEPQLRNIRWVLDNLDYPTREDYPWAPAELFSEDVTYSNIRDAFELVQPPNLRVHEHFRLIRAQNEDEEDCWKHHLTANFTNGQRPSIKVLGEANQKLEAGISSYMQLIEALHTEQLLKEPDHDNQLGSLIRSMDAAKKDWTLKLQVYNLAAFFGTVPNIDVHKVAGEESSIWHASVSIDTIDGLSLRGEGSAVSLQDAELDACTSLKQHAESVWSGQNDAPIDLRNPDHVNVDNASVLLDFYNAIHPTAKLDKRIKTGALPDGSFGWSIVYSLNNAPLGPTVHMQSKDRALVLANLVTAVHLTRRHPKLLDEFRTARLRAHGLQLPLQKPVQTSDLNTLEPLMQPMLKSFRRGRMSNPASSFERLDPRSPAASFANPGTLLSQFQRRSQAHAHHISHARRSENLRISQEYYWYNPALDEVKRERLALPVMNYRKELLETINNNPYSIVVGATASGKSTQIPQILLEDAVRQGQGASCNVICTQPRRVAAESLARRVADERDEMLGEVVGYQISGKYMTCELDGSITYCTPELLTIQLELDEDTVMSNTSHILIDEAHQRGFQTDRVITAVKGAAERRRAAGKHAPKITIMSATLHAEEFQDYLGTQSREGPERSVPVLDIPGRLYPVQELFLDDVVRELNATLSKEDREFVMEDDQTRAYLANEATEEMSESTTVEGIMHSLPTLPIRWTSSLEASDRREGPSARLVAATIAHVSRSTNRGDILVFLPGLYAIDAVKRELEEHSQIYQVESTQYKLLMLHSMSPEALDEALRPPEDLIRRIFLATDIAETSLTFSHVTQVIDSGRRRIPTRHTSFGVDFLQEHWISQSSRTQRAGRAGRVQPGTYHALFSKSRFDTFLPTVSNRTLSPVELMRPALRGVRMFPKEELSRYFDAAINRPDAAEIEGTLALLRSMEALTDEDELTNLGKLLSQIPLVGRSGLLVPLGIIFGCLEPLVIFAIVLNENQFFLRGWDKHSARRGQTMRLFYARGTYSDHIAILNAYRELRQIRQDQGDESAAEWALNSFIDYNRFLSVDRQVQSLLRLLTNMGMMSAEQRSTYNHRADDNKLILALATAALYPNIGVHKDRDRYMTPIGVDGRLSKYSSVLLQRSASQRDNPLKDSIVGFSTYQFLAHDTASLLNLSTLSPLAILLFAGDKLKSRPDAPSILVIDNWFSFDVGDEATAQAILQLKQTWKLVWHNALAEFAMGRVQGIAGLRDRKAREDVVQNIVDLLQLEKDGTPTRIEYSAEDDGPLNKLESSRSLETFASVEASRGSASAEPRSASNSQNNQRKVFRNWGQGFVDKGARRDQADYKSEWGSELPHEA